LRSRGICLSFKMTDGKISRKTDRVHPSQLRHIGNDVEADFVLLREKPGKRFGGNDQKLDERTRQPSTGDRKISAVKTLANKQRNRGGRRNTGQIAGASLPPTINGVVQLTHTFRYASSGTLTNTSITVGSILGALGGICTVANTTLQCWTSSFRIKWAKVWVNPSTTNDEVSWVWSDFSLDRDQERAMTRDLPANVSVAAAVKYVPAPGTLVADWFSAGVTSTDQLATVSCPAGSIVDFHVDFTLNARILSVALTRSITTGTLGNTYWLALDGVSTNLLRPRILPSTT